MDDQRTADGVEHLQTAARELLAAARSFLDVAEEVVEDNERFSGVASSFADLVRGGLGTVAGPLERTGFARREPAWMRDDPDHPDSPDPDVTDTSERSDSEPVVVADDSGTPDSEPPARPRRVKRIAVD